MLSSHSMSQLQLHPQVWWLHLEKATKPLEKPAATSITGNAAVAMLHQLFVSPEDSTKLRLQRKLLGFL